MLTLPPSFSFSTDSFSRLHPLCAPSIHRIVSGKSPPKEVKRECYPDLTMWGGGGVFGSAKPDEKEERKEERRGAGRRARTRGICAPDRLHRCSSPYKFGAKHAREVLIAKSFQVRFDRGGRVVPPVFVELIREEQQTIILGHAHRAAIAMITPRADLVILSTASLIVGPLGSMTSMHASPQP